MKETKKFKVSRKQARKWMHKLWDIEACPDNNVCGTCKLTAKDIRDALTKAYEYERND